MVGVDGLPCTTRADCPWVRSRIFGGVPGSVAVNEEPGRTMQERSVCIAPDFTLTPLLKADAFHFPAMKLNPINLLILPACFPYRYGGPPRFRRLKKPEADENDILLNSLREKVDLYLVELPKKLGEIVHGSQCSQKISFSDRRGSSAPCCSFISSPIWKDYFRLSAGEYCLG